MMTAEGGGERFGLIEPGGIEGRRMEGQRRRDHGGVIGGETGEDGFAVAP